MLKANPGEVQELIEVPVPRPRDYSQLTTPQFIATKARLKALIHTPAAADKDDAGMTDVADNVA